MSNSQLPGRRVYGLSIRLPWGEYLGQTVLSG